MLERIRQSQRYSSGQQTNNNLIGLYAFFEIEDIFFRGTWVVQSVKYPTVGFSSGHVSGSWD